MERAFTVSSRVLLAALFLLVVFQAASRALTIDEATIWDHLVHGSFRSAFIAPDAWNGLVYAILAKRAIGLFRLSELTMRLPAVLAGAIYLVVLTRHMRPPIAVLLAVPPMALGWFSTATPHGVALVLVLCAAVSLRVERRAVLFGLAIATSPIFAVPLAALAIYGALGQ